jgi:hypothetical protein
MSQKMAIHDKALADQHRNNLLTTMSGKRSFQESITALQPTITPNSVNASSGPGEKAGPSKLALQEQKVENVKEKRRRIRERGEILGDSLVDEGRHMVGVLDRIADAIIPVDSSDSPLTSNLGTVQRHIDALEHRTTAMEQAVADVQADTKEILLLLKSRSTTA